jgi:hypothetical protein
MSERDDDLITLLRADLADAATTTPREGFEMRMWDAVHGSTQQRRPRTGAHRLMGPALALATAAVLAAALSVGIYSRARHNQAPATNPPAVTSPTANPAVRGLTSTGMPSRTGFSLGWDPVSHRLLLFGGEHRNGPSPTGEEVVYNQTWAWDGHIWSRLNTPQAPPYGLGTAMVVDPHTGRLMLLGGDHFGTTPSGGSWTWDGSAWHRLGPAADVPVQPNVGDLGSDPATGEVLVDGPIGDGSQSGAFAWNGSVWRRLSVPSPSDELASSTATFAYDPGSRHVLHIGGGTVAPVNQIDPTFAYDGNGWSRLPASAAAPDGAADAVTDDRGRVLLLTHDPGFPRASQRTAMFVWQQSSWVPLHPAHLPPSLGPLVWDADLHAAVLLTTTPPSEAANGMWIWDGIDWREVPGTSLPEPATSPTALG